MTSAIPAQAKEPSRRNHDLNGSKSNSRPTENPTLEGRPWSTVPRSNPISRHARLFHELNPVDQTGCFDKPSLARYLKLSVRTWIASRRGAFCRLPTWWSAGHPGGAPPRLNGGCGPGRGSRAGEGGHDLLANTREGPSDQGRQKLHDQ